MVEKSGRSVAITGAGGGLGREIALQLAAKSYRVFGTAFTAAEVEDLNDVRMGQRRVDPDDVCVGLGFGGIGKTVEQS